MEWLERFCSCGPDSPSGDRVAQSLHFFPVETDRCRSCEKTGSHSSDSDFSPWQNVFESSGSDVDLRQMIGECPVSVSCATQDSSVHSRCDDFPLGRRAFSERRQGQAANGYRVCLCRYLCPLKEASPKLKSHAPPRPKGYLRMFARIFQGRPKSLREKKYAFNVRFFAPSHLKKRV